MHHLTCGISSLLHSVNLVLFTLLVHLILRTVTTFALTICHSLRLSLQTVTGAAASHIRLSPSSESVKSAIYVQVFKIVVSF